VPELITAIEAYAGWLYAVLAILFARELFATLSALRARSHARFRVELDAASSRAVRGLVSLLLLTVIAFGTNLVATVIAPSLPADVRRRLGDEPLTVPTVLAPLATATSTRVPSTATPEPVRIVTPTVGVGGGVEATVTTAAP